MDTISNTRVTFNIDKFVAALNAIREYRRIEWNDLAKEAEVSTSTLARMQKGEHPNAQSLCRLVSFMNADLREFITIEVGQVVEPEAVDEQS